VRKLKSVNVVSKAVTDGMTVTGCESYYIRVIRVCLSSALARRGSPRLNPSERESLDDTGNAQTEYNGVKSDVRA